MDCKECGNEIEEYYNVLLCNRCIKARCWEMLEEDEYILIRRNDRGRLTMESPGRYTDIGYLYKSGAVTLAMTEVKEFIESKPYRTTLW